MGKRIVILLALSWCWVAQAAQTVVTTEYFTPSSQTNVIALTSTNLSHFTAIAGTLPIYAGGATTNGQTDGGWSFNMQRTSATVGCISNVSAFGVAGAWYKFNQFSVASSDATNADTFAASAEIMYGQNNVGHYMICTVGGAGTLYIKDFVNTITCTNLQINTWYWIGMAWNSFLSGTWNNVMQLYVAPLGGSPVMVGTTTNTSINAAIKSIGWGFNGDQTGLWSGRVSGISVSTITSFADVAIPGVIIAPTTNQVTWFVNPSTGSDNNSGLYGFPWATGNKLTTSLHFGGIQGNVNPWVTYPGLVPITNTITDPNFISAFQSGAVIPSGDKLLIDTSAATLYLTNQLHLYGGNSGVSIGSTNGQAVLDGRKIIGPTYTQYDSVNFPNIWQITDSEASVTLHEDDKWMNSPLGANITAVRTNLNTTAGSFWTDGTTMYLAPFGNTNPNSDGKVYKRTLKLYDNGTAQFVHMGFFAGSNNVVSGINFRQSPFRTNSNGGVIANAVVQQRSNARSIMTGCGFWGGGNHAYVAPSGDSTMSRWLLLSVCEQCAPWTNNATGFVNCTEFSDQSTAGNRKAYFTSCNFATNAVIGSALGTNDGTGGWYCHDGGFNAGQYDVIQLNNCVGSFASGTMVKAGGILITNCLLSAFDTEAVTNVICQESRINGPIYGNQGATLRNTIINRNDDITQDGRRMSGTWSFTGCTIDCRNPSAVALNEYFFKSALTNTLTLNMTNCSIFLPSAVGTNLTWLGFKTNDTITCNYNVIVPNGDGNVTRNTSGGSTNYTFAAWQSLGKDANSSSNNPCWDANYRPYAKTPSWTSGAEIGPLIDYSGKLFQSRRTAGAYEYITRRPQMILRP